MALRKIISVETVNNSFKWIEITNENDIIKIADHGTLQFDDFKDFYVKYKKNFIKTIPIVLTMAADQYKYLDSQILDLYPDISNTYHIINNKSKSLIAIPRCNLKKYLTIFNRRPFKFIWLEEYQQTILQTIKFFLPKLALVAITQTILVINYNDNFLTLDCIVNYKILHTASVEFQDNINVSDTILKFIDSNNLSINLILIIGISNIPLNKKLLMKCSKILYIENLISEHCDHVPCQFAIAFLATIKYLNSEHIYA